MPWVSPGPQSGGPYQTPYFIASYSIVTGGVSGGVEHDKDGFCNAFRGVVGSGTRFVASTWFFPTVPYTISQVRVYAAVTGTAPSANLIVALWWGVYEGRNLGSITPDGVATIPLSSLPLVSSADNYTCHALPSPTIANLAAPITQTVDNQNLAVALYLDNGFISTSNVVFGTVATAPSASATNNNLDFTGYSGTVTKEWCDLPNTACAAVFGSGSTNFKVSPVDLNITGAAVATAANWAAVIG